MRQAQSLRFIEDEVSRNKKFAAMLIALFRRMPVMVHSYLGFFKIQRVDFLRTNVAQEQRRAIGRNATPGKSLEDHPSKPF
jgi:hypothetical protein